MSRVNANFESALEKVARIMTRNFDGINVVIQGNSAMTDGKTIYLPMLEDVPEELMADLNGFVDHEVSHCKYTEFDQLPKCLNRFHRELLNATEDSRIELLLPKEYPGTHANLSRLNAKWGSKVAANRHQMPWPIRLILAIRETYDGKSVHVDPDFEPLYRRIEAQAKALPKCTSTTQLRKATEQIVHDINDERRKLAMGLPDPEDDDFEGMPQTGETPIALGDKKKNAKKKKVGNQNQEIDPSVEEQNQNSGEGEGEESDPSEGEGGEEGKEGEEGEGDGEGKQKGKGKESGEDSEEDGEGEGAGGEEGEEKAGKAGKPDGEGGEEKPKKVETRKNYAKWVESEKEKSMMEEKDGAEEGESEYDRHIMSAESYMAREIAKEIKRQPKVDRSRGYYSGRSTISEAVSLPVSREYDLVTDYTAKGDQTEYGKKKQAVMPLINPIKQHLERVLKVKENARYRFNRERGAINARALAQVAASDSFRTPFKEFGKTDTTNVAVQLLIDQSGSMAYDKIEIARQTALAIGESLNALGIAFEVTGFYTEGNSQLSSMSSRLGSDETARFNRFGERLVLNVFKRFDSPNLNGITKVNSGGSNCDGESVVWAAKRLAQRKEKRKVMLVLSDGQPAVPGSNHEVLAGDLRRVIRLLPKAGIEVVGFGILTEDVKLFYPEYVVVDDLSKLPTQVMSKVAKILERGIK